MTGTDLGLEKPIALFEEHICVNRHQAALTVTAYLSRIRGFVRHLRGGDGGGYLYLASSRPPDGAVLR